MDLQEKILLARETICELGRKIDRENMLLCRSEDFDDLLDIIGKSRNDLVRLKVKRAKAKKKLDRLLSLAENPSAVVPVAAVKIRPWPFRLRYNRSIK